MQIDVSSGRKIAALRPELCPKVTGSPSTTTTRRGCGTCNAAARPAIPAPMMSVVGGEGTALVFHATQALQRVWSQIAPEVFKTTNQSAAASPKPFVVDAQLANENA
jgi:hypothetical protein